jgi:hypothetical protein
MKMDTYEYIVADHWGSAIINGDYSGLSDDEEIQLNEWLDANQEAGAHWDIGDSLGFDKCEISGMMSDCVQLIQNVVYRG